MQTSTRTLLCRRQEQLAGKSTLSLTKKSVPELNDQPSYNRSQTWTLTKRDRKQLNIFERKVYRRILGPEYDNEKENWRILTKKEIYAGFKKTYYNRDNKVK